MEKQDEKKLLTTLKSIDCTLKRIERLFAADRQHEVIKYAVSHAMMGERYISPQKRQVDHDADCEL